MHLGGPQLQQVIFNIPGALVEIYEENKNDVFNILVEKFNNFFSPKRNSTFERHLFRSLCPSEGEDFNKFLLRLRHQVSKCDFGSTKNEMENNCLKDKLIDSWAPVELKKRLLEKEQSLDEVIGACQVYEQINKQSQSMFPKSDCEAVSKISSRQQIRDNCKKCGRCGKSGHIHSDASCPARKSKCNICGLIGHCARKCKTKGQKRKSGEYERGSPKKRRFHYSNINYIAEQGRNMEDKSCSHGCFKVNCIGSGDEIIECRIGGHTVSMIIDSGSRFNLLSQRQWVELQNNKAVLFNVRRQSTNQFKAYAATQILKVLFVFEAPITVEGNKEVIATFYLIENANQSLLGRETAIKLHVLKLGRGVNNVDTETPFPKIRNIEIKLSLNLSVKPIQQPMRRIPIVIEEKVEQKINEALAQDIIEPVLGPSSWISPIVAVFKDNGEIRLCVDMRRANQAVLRENYPLPTFDNFMTKLRGAKLFSRLDLKWAYHQLELDESSREITTFITHKGVFRYKRLMFGINSAPEIFQRVLEELLSPCKNCLNYIDDVIIFGITEKDHNEALEKVLEVFKKNNFLLNYDKCVWRVKKLKFLGHILSDDGIAPDPGKIDTISNFRAPESKEEIRSFLSLVTYVSKFIPDMANITEPLRSILKKGSKFTWGPAQQNSFKKLKVLLSDIPKLSYFNPKHKTRLIADASPVALGAVLVQFNPSGDPQIISYSSKSLLDVEKRYSQTEKESLALVWVVERFFYYLAGLEFELVTDHKPLEAIFKPTSNPPARIERWLLRLQSYKFKVIYRSGKENIADSVSRLCKIESTGNFDDNGEQNIFQIISHSTPSSLTISEIAKKSAQDEEIRVVAVDDILLRGTRIVMPKALRPRLLELAHEGHPGESAMKRRIRTKV
ncbi:PREDICTED: uncharacterized protein LOC108360273 isoform X2 [Rhagoletis zephyria]|nr:PREDICTED: uncharacterized protein LOC108360273 isoform X2 [Rhagoletis zephyria]